MSLRRLVVDTAAMSSVNMLRLLTQFLVVPVLARFLSPTDYGLVGLAMPFLFFAMIIADAGVGMSLVRTPADERGVWSTCFWLSVLLGLALATLMATLAPLASLLFDEPRLGPMVMALALVVLAQALMTVPGAVLQQSGRFRVIARIEMAAVIISIGTAVVIALYGGGAWALIGQQLAAYAVRLTLTWLYAPFRPLMTFDLHSAKEHLTFGGHVLSVNLVGFFTRSLDNLVIGKVLGAAAVGVYSMTFQFVRLPMMIVTGPLLYVLYPQLVQIRDDKQAVRQMYLFITRVLAILLFPVIAMVATSNRSVFNLLLSDKWSTSGELFLLLAPACALQTVTALGGTVRMALGRTDIQLRATVEFGVIWIATLLTSAWFGLEWVALAYNCAVLLYSPRSLALVLPLIECSAVVYVATLITPAVVTLACIAIFWGCNQAQRFDELGQLGLSGALAVFGIIASALIQRHSLRAEATFWRHLIPPGPERLGYAFTGRG